MFGECSRVSYHLNITILLWWSTIFLHVFTGCGVFVGLLGVAYYANIHTIAYFIVVQVFVGVFEVSNGHRFLPHSHCELILVA